MPIAQLIAGWTRPCDFHVTPAHRIWGDSKRKPAMVSIKIQLCVSVKLKKYGYSNIPQCWTLDCVFLIRAHFTFNYAFHIYICWICPKVYALDYGTNDASVILTDLFYVIMWFWHVWYHYGSEGWGTDFCLHVRTLSLVSHNMCFCEAETVFHRPHTGICPIEIIKT